MLTLTLLSIAATPVISLLSAGTKPVTGRETIILYDRPVGEDGHRLVIARGPNRDGKLIGFTVPPERREGLMAYELRVQLVPADGQPLILASRLQVEDEKVLDTRRGVYVLDTLVETGRVTIGLAEGTALTVWQVGVPGTTAWHTHATHAGALSPLAEASAAPRKLDVKNVSMKLVRLPDGRLGFQTTYQNYHTAFEQEGEDRLVFKRVKQWEGGPAATKPSR